MSYWILVGFLGCVVYGLLTWGLFNTVNKFILPWHERRAYHGTHVDGDWTGKLEDGDTEYGYRIHLKQNGHVVTGKYKAENRRHEGTATKITTKEYELVGGFYGDCLLLRYLPSDPRTFGSGAFLFQPAESGRVLEGGMIYYRTRFHDIGSRYDLKIERTL